MNDQTSPVLDARVQVQADGDERETSEQGDPPLILDDIYGGVMANIVEDFWDAVAVEYSN